MKQAWGRGGFDALMSSGGPGAHPSHLTTPAERPLRTFTHTDGSRDPQNYKYREHQLKPAGREAGGLWGTMS